jgi:hypothetical protein
MVETGVVESFNKNEICGFIKNLKTNQSIFCNFKNKNKILYPGEYVNFNIKYINDFNSECIDVTGIGGGDLLCENKYYTYNLIEKNRPINNFEHVHDDVDIAFILESIDNSEF